MEIDSCDAQLFGDLLYNRFRPALANDQIAPQFLQGLAEVSNTFQQELGAKVAGFGKPKGGLAKLSGVKAVKRNDLGFCF